MNYQKLYSEICKLEGKKIQVSKANVAEVIKCLCILEAKYRARSANRRGDAMFCYRMSSIMKMIDNHAITLSRRAHLEWAMPHVKTKISKPKRKK